MRADILRGKLCVQAIARTSNKGTVKVRRMLTAGNQSRIYTQALHPPDIPSGGFRVSR